MDFREKRNLKKMLYSRFTIILLVVILFFLSQAVWSVYKKAKIAYVGKVDAQNRLTNLENREAALVLGITKFKSERGIESEIRDKFGVVKNGEELVVIVDSDQIARDDARKNDTNISLWKKFISFFIN